MKTINRLINKIKERLHIPLGNQKGIVLPIILMAIGGLSLIGAAAISVTTGEIGIANNDKMYKSALNLAEAGISDANDGIQGNRALIPRPIGAVPNASYSFNTALASGRYQVSVELPVVTTISAQTDAGTSTVIVTSTSNLGPGDTIIIGDTTTHMLAKIGSITGTTINLVDSKGQPYILPYNATTSMFVAKNIIRMTSTGQSGTGLTGGTLAAWRNNPATLGNTALPAGGIIRSTATLQGEYSMQEIEIMDSFRATVTTTGNKFNGPMLVTDRLDVRNYQKDDYSGPIFISSTIANTNNAQINLTQQPAPQPNIFPKVIVVPAATINANTMITQAQNNANCFQQQCSVASASQQIYYLNGYELDVKSYKSPVSGNGLNMQILEDTTLSADGNYITFQIVLNNTFYMSSNDNVTVVLNSNPNPGTLLGAGNTNLTISNMTYTVPSPLPPGSTSGNIAVNGTGNLTFDNNQWYFQNTIINVTVPTANIPIGGTYMRMYDNSNNATGLTGGAKEWSNGIWITKLGNIESQEKQGDINWYADGGPTSHPNHSVIQTAKPPKNMRGLYSVNNSTLATSATWVTNGEGAVLFGGRLANAADAQWLVGDTASYWITYHIHTNAVGSCNDHDIEVVSYTKVTYLGKSKQCPTSTETKRVFLYETIWNHTPTNYFATGMQPDDADPNLGTIPHKGYFKWVNGKDVTKNEPIKVSQLMGDKEFISVFNHSADTRFTSSIVNVNIEKIRMIGWSNPPMSYNLASTSMQVNPVTFAAVPFEMPTNSDSWDWPDMVGTRSQFLLWPSAPYGIDTSRGFNFADMSIASGSIVPYTISGNSVLPDMSGVNAKTTTLPNNPGTGTVNLYSATTSPAEVITVTTNNGTIVGGQVKAGGIWATSLIGGTAAIPGNPIMDPNKLPSTTFTSTINGPWFTKFEVKRGSANLFFNAANGIPFNVAELKIESKGAGANITIGTSTNPATVFAGQFGIESEDCGGQVNFSFTGKLVSPDVQFDKNVKYNIDTTLSNAATCLSSGMNYIYLKKQSWKELRN